MKDDYFWPVVIALVIMLVGIVVQFWWANAIGESDLSPWLKLWLLR